MALTATITLALPEYPVFEPGITSPPEGFVEEAPGEVWTLVGAAYERALAAHDAEYRGYFRDFVAAAMAGAPLSTAEGEAQGTNAHDMAGAPPVTVSGQVTAAATESPMASHSAEADAAPGPSDPMDSRASAEDDDPEGTPARSEGRWRRGLRVLRRSIGWTAVAGATAAAVHGEADGLQALFNGALATPPTPAELATHQGVVNYGQEFAHIAGRLTVLPCFENMPTSSALASILGLGAAAIAAGGYAWHRKKKHEKQATQEATIDRGTPQAASAAVADQIEPGATTTVDTVEPKVWSLGEEIMHLRPKSKRSWRERTTKVGWVLRVVAELLNEPSTHKLMVEPPHGAMPVYEALPQAELLSLSAE